MFFSPNFRVVAAAFAAHLCVLASPALATTGPGGRPATKPSSPPTQAVTLATTPTPAAEAPATTAGAAAPDAPQMLQLKGVVVNADGRPCPGASVYPAGAPRQLVVTDAQGGFVLPVLAGTAVSLQVEYFGVGSSRVAVEKPSDAPLRIVLGQ